MSTVLEVEGIAKAYGSKAAVDDVSFSVEAGEIFGLLGPNGAGKTTTVECVAGLRKPDRGSIRVLGLDPRAQGGELRRRLGVQLQESQQPDKLRVEEALDLYGSFYDEPPGGRAALRERLLDQLGLTGSRSVAYRKLSGGQKQRLSIALALVGQPEMVILDELTTGLDPQARRDTWALIEQVRASGVTVLLVTHAMEEAERLCDRVAIIDGGRVIALDTPDNLVAGTVDEQVLRFRPSAPIDERLLRDLPEVTDVTSDGRELTVRGGGDVIHAVTAVLARNGVVARTLRIEQPSLDDAFVSLTGRRTEAGAVPAEGEL